MDTAAQPTGPQHSQEDGFWISSSLFQLYTPSEDPVQLDIIFFHGPQLACYSDAHLSTWRSSDALQEVWPQAWLPTECPQARIITVAYDANIKTTDTEGRMDMYLIGESLMQEILLVRGGYSRNCPIILVGHSFGGLVIKKLCCFAHNNKETSQNADSIDAFLDSLKGVFFYATPHLGMDESGIEDLCSGSQEGAAVGVPNADLLNVISKLSKEAGRLHGEFSQIVNKYGWNIYAVGETQLTPGRRTLLVSEASSRFGARSNFITTGCDHFSVCRPDHKSCIRYTYLVDLVRQIKTEVAKFPTAMVGVDSLLERVHEDLRKYKFLGLYGVNGVGKTAIAKQVFHKLLDKFEYACFMEDFQRISGDKDELKKRMWEEMYHHGRLISHGGGYSTRRMWREVSGKTLLVILDGIDSKEQVEFLEIIAEENAMKYSRFIVTSRDKRLLSLLSTFEIPELDDEAARELFMNHAFPNLEEPPKILKSYVKEIVETCRGLPLTLKVCGRYLQTRTDEKIWAETLAVLKDHGDSLHCLEYQQLRKLMEKVDERCQIAHYKHLAEMAIQNVTPIVTVGGCGGGDFYCYGTEEKILQKIEVWAIPFWIKAIRVWFTDETPKIFGDPSDRTDVEYEEFTFNPTERITFLSLWENGGGNCQ